MRSPGCSRRHRFRPSVFGFETGTPGRLSAIAANELSNDFRYRRSMVCPSFGDPRPTECPRERPVLNRNPIVATWGATDILILGTLTERYFIRLMRIATQVKVLAGHGLSMTDTRRRLGRWLKKWFMKFYLKIDEVATIITYSLSIPILLLSLLFADVLEVLRGRLWVLSTAYLGFLCMTTPVFIYGRWKTHHRSGGIGRVEFVCWLCEQSMSADYLPGERPVGICQTCGIRMVEKSFTPIRFRNRSMPEIDLDDVQDE